MRNKAFLWAVVAAVVLCVPAAAQAQFFWFGNPLLGKPAPEFSLTTVSGNRVDFGAARDGRPAVILFWATWCPHCREALKDLQRESGEFQQKGIGLFLIDLQESPRQVASYLKAHGLNFDVLLDRDAGVAAEYSVVGLPTYVLINAGGEVVNTGHVLPAAYQKLLLES